MTMDFDGFSRLVREGDARHVLNSTMFFAIPSLFRSHPELYDEFRFELARSLRVPERGIALVGSGQLGFSLNPHHLGRPVSDQSDLDVVIVSPPRFDSTWLELNELQSEWFLEAIDKARIYRCREDLFWGFIRLEELPRRVSLVSEWFPVLDRLSIDPRFGRRKVSGRLYRTWEQVERSCIQSVNQIPAPTR